MLILAKYAPLWRCIVVAVVAPFTVSGALAATANSATLSLQQAIVTAHRNDPWLDGNTFRQEAIEAASTAAGTLPDPVVSIGLANIDTDSFDFNQDPMSQFKVAVSQVFPRGKSLDLQQKQLTQMSTRYPYQRDNRRAKVAVTVAQLWLETYRAQDTIRLIEADRELFEHLVDVARSSYSTTLGRTRQQDLVRAQLELTRLEDRLTKLHQKREKTSNLLGEWLRSATIEDRTASSWMDANSGVIRLPGALPEIPLIESRFYQKGNPPKPQDLAVFFLQHPAVLDLDANIAASDTGIDLARQTYKPQWGLSAGYGYRDDDPTGRDRPDLFSVGVTFDLPLFTTNRQDKQVQSAVATAEATRTDRALLLRNMLAAFNAQRANLLRLEERRELYRNRLLNESHDQAEASLTAYTNDDGDFAEVMRARIAELNTRIEALDIDIDRLKIISQLNYFFAKSSS